MFTLISSLFIALLLPYLAKIPLAVAMHKQGRYDNNHPRAQQNQLKGFGARALAAHQNAFESVIIFAPAILLAITTSHINNTVEILAMVHIAARVIYHILYLINWSTLRSTFWMIATSCSFIIVYTCLG